MPEGLDPVEAGRKLHEHTHEEEERAAQRDADKAADRHSRILQSGEALLLALVTIAAAWAGYAAARWGTASRVEIAQSSTLRNLATRADLEALTTRNFDSSTFDAWFIAYTLGNKQKEAVADAPVPARVPGRVQRLDGHQPAAQPESPARARPTCRSTRLPQQAKANALDAAATAKFDEGNHGGEISDDYIRITVFLAAVLFLVGIGSTFKLHQIRYALITFGTALLILAVVLLFHEPGLPS